MSDNLVEIAPEKAIESIEKCLWIPQSKKYFLAAYLEYSEDNKGYQQKIKGGAFWALSGSHKTGICKLALEASYVDYIIIIAPEMKIIIMDKDLYHKSQIAPDGDPNQPEIRTRWAQVVSLEIRDISDIIRTDLYQRMLE